MTARSAEQPAGRAATATSRWQDGLPHEATFWDDVISGIHPRFSEVFRERLAPDRPLAEAFRAMVDVPAGGALRILDVGAGPCTVVGARWEERRVEITAVDPLADRFATAFRRAGITPPVTTIFGEAERLTEQFPPGSFDIAFCHNALDHSYDPVRAIDQMLAVVRVGGVVRLDHCVNEGAAEEYVGLHQWNFCARDGHFVVWNPAGSVDVTERLGDAVSMWCHATDKWITVQMRRLK